MKVRLGFAVAAHLDPEILLVDEVLSVGDVAFQQKCLGKMGDVTRDGRTVLFVSHNMAAVQSLCPRSLLLDNGELLRQGQTQEVVQQYLQATFSAKTTPLDQRLDRSGDGSVRASSLRVESADQEGLIGTRSRLRLTLEYESDGPLRFAKFIVTVHNYGHTAIFLLDSEAAGGLPAELPAKGTITCVTDPIHLAPGRCYVNLSILKRGRMADYVAGAAHFRVAADDFYGSGKLPKRGSVLCLLRHQWALNGSHDADDSFRG